MNIPKTILFFLIFSSFLHLKAQKYNFRQFSVDNGLSQSQVYAIEQDVYGNMWLGTYGGGITIYNGAETKYLTTSDGLPSYSILSLLQASDSTMWIGTINGAVIYRENKIVAIDTSSSLKGTVWSFVESPDETIWLGTDNGLWKYDKSGLHKFDNPNLEEAMILSLRIDNDGKLWGFSVKQGIILYDGELLITNVIPEIKNLLVEDIYCDNENTIWFATSEGIYYYKNNEIKKLTQHFKNSNGHFLSIYKDNDNNLWIGSENNGLTIIRKDETLYLNKNQGLGFIAIPCLFGDRSGNVWVGTDGGGVSIFNGFLFSHYDLSDISNNFIMTILVDKNNNKWFGTDGDGVIFLNKHRKFLLTTKDGLAGNLINDIIQDKTGNIWIATNSGLSRYNGKTFKNFTRKNGLVSDTVFSLLETKDGSIWCGSIGEGISRFDGTVFHKYYSEINYEEDFTWMIYQAKNGLIYFATESGLREYNGKSFKSYTKKDGLNENHVWAIAEDNNGIIWLGNEDLVSFNGKTFKNHKLKDILNFDVIYLLKFDDNGNLIIGTEKGIDRISFNKNSEIIAVKHFGKKEGFTGIECNSNAIAKDKSGRFFIGTIKGVTVYNPAEDKQDTIPPQLYISKIKLFYKNVNWSDYSNYLYGEYKLPSNLKLRYNQNTLTFSFIGIDYKSPEKVQYQFKLDGFDENWHPVTSKNEATFTNLPHGKYSFMVKACNHDGVWVKNPVKFNFEIITPYWFTWWFVTLAIIFIIFLVYGYVFLNTMRLKKLHAMLTQKVSERTRMLNQQKNELISALNINKNQKEKLEQAYEEVKESSRLKEIFLANTSHEIRTPLNVIIGFTNLLLKSKLDRQQLTYLNNISVSSDNLLAVLNDILDFSKIEANNLTLNKVDFKIHETINNCCIASSVKVQEKNINFTQKISKDIPEYLYGDPVRLSQILTNLIRNAIKFTNDSGSISINIDLLDKKNDMLYLLFSVKDTGIGISKEHQKLIFESFTQAKSDMTRQYGGTGLGLSIVKRLIDLHNGEITLTSKEGKGSTFAFTIGYQVSDIKKIKKDIEAEEKSLLNAKYHSEILLVEDNKLNINLAIDTILSFNENINIDVAENGQIALEKAQNKDYDLIIMDIQMPVMDGYEATSYIRNHFPESKKHIPILGMTAHAMNEEKEKCFELGMNDYLTKPFVPEELFKKITNLVKKIEITEKISADQKIEKADMSFVYTYINLEILGKTYKGNKQKIAKILELCLSNIPKQIHDLTKHYESESWKNLRVVAHSLKTSLNYLGMKPLREAALTIEKNAAEEKELSEVPSLIQTINNGWNEALNELQQVHKKFLKT
ncbi:MAG: response regulator [Chlorobi bacterium]|nr:response regulator [Chlorobiota bacterium]